MGLSAAAAWWVLAGLLVAAELATGTFYLLMFALGLAAAALAAHLGLDLTWQLVAAALVGGGATAAWHLQRRSRAGKALPVSADRDVNLDVGERVHVQDWAGDRTTRVTYRGSVWNARLDPSASPSSGLHRVSAVEGNWLVLVPSTAL
jgi:membrane protein implicated in regulation of membrane protease activity